MHIQLQRNSFKHEYENIVQWTNELTVFDKVTRNEVTKARGNWGRRRKVAEVLNIFTYIIRQNQVESFSNKPVASIIGPGM